MVEKAVTANINDFFQPRGVAIVGASAKPGTPGNQVVQFSKQMSLTGNVYPVNPKADEIEGLKCYPDLLAIPFPVDLVVIAVSAQRILDVMWAIKKAIDPKGIMNPGKIWPLWRE